MQIPFDINSNNHFQLLKFASFLSQFSYSNKQSLLEVANGECSVMLKDLTIISQLIQTYAKTIKLQKGKQLHAHLLTSTGIPSTFISNHLLNMYSKCGNLDDALSMFDHMPQRNLVTWTAMITGFSHNSMFLNSLRTFSDMCAAGIQPTQFAFSSAVQAAAALRSLAFGLQLHSLSLKLAYNTEMFVGSNLADMYSKCDSFAIACKIFDELPEKDEVSWTAMIDGYAKNGDTDQALAAFQRVVGNESLVADQHVFCSALNACAALRAGKLGRSIHAGVLKSGFLTETAVGNSLTDMYSKAGDMESAAAVLTTSHNVVSCTSLIDGYVEMDRIEEAIAAYTQSKRRGVHPNEFTFSTLIKACASDAALDQGIQFHAQAIKTSFVLDSFVRAGLLDMYGKCGLLSSSYQIFEETHNPTNITWNSIINVFAHHGRGRKAIEAFHQMVAMHMEPTHVTFISLLMACSHSGLVQQGLQFFHTMHETFNIKPKDEHYSCVIDMLARAGKLQEAKTFIGEMPHEPNAHAWCSILAACRTHGRKDLAELAAQKLIKLEPANTGTNVLLSTVYAGEQQWEDVKAVRRIMKDVGRKKLPGLSWIEVEKKNHVFGAEDWSHPRKDEIYEKMEGLLVRIREEGYVPYTGAVVSNVEESEKERLLRHHSERIAVAFALISLPVGRLIVVKKNLRICVDCHSVIKLIAKVERRVIVVRDCVRFHHFEDGICSCGDYW